VHGEEGGAAAGVSGRTWYVDPIDGTTNFVHGYSHFCVSIACVDGSGSLLGAVHAPYLDELHTAVRGEGAVFERPRRAERRELPPRAPVALSSALLATGFPYLRDARVDRNTELLRRFLKAGCHGVRRGGSAALDLCHVGCGKLDGYWEMGLHAWDVAAGELIARETGCIVTDFAGVDDGLPCASVVAAVPGLHARMLAMIAEVP
jgi:myo-inositol-1(or 4)-monophosphatase